VHVLDLNEKLKYIDARCIDFLNYEWNLEYNKNEPFTLTVTSDVSDYLNLLHQQIHPLQIKKVLVWHLTNPIVNNNTYLLCCQSVQFILCTIKLMKGKGYFKHIHDSYILKYYNVLPKLCTSSTHSYLLTNVAKIAVVSTQPFRSFNVRSAIVKLCTIRCCVDACRCSLKEQN